MKAFSLVINLFENIPMASGLPVVVTDVGGSKELLKNNGTLVKKGSTKALRDAIMKYDEKLILKQGKASRKKAEQMSWKNICDQYFEVYKTIVKK